MNWISVKDRLPEFDVSVLVFCPVWGRYLAYYNQIDGDFGQWCNWDMKCGLLPPTHWMPLPEPPDEA